MLQTLSVGGKSLFQFRERYEFLKRMDELGEDGQGWEKRGLLMLRRINFWLVFLTVIVSGISVGAMLGEQKTMVPFWMELSPADFYSWYGKNAARLSGFFAPWQIASAVLTLVTAVFFQIQGHRAVRWLWPAALFAIAVLATFFIYFKSANAAFVAGKLTATQLADALSTWSAWQWGRISLGFAAFASALMGAVGGARE